MAAPRIRSVSASTTSFIRPAVSLLFPDTLDFLVTSQDSVSSCPRERRGDISRMPDFKARPGDVLLVGPGKVRDVPVLDADPVEGFGGRPIEKRRGRGLVEK